ncbi:MAG TPA: 3-deoxy-7-phosphoheptulonate synthase [Planctomycetota bacterium]|nr:3-deoxy-7-phosphoheptulonate synthase [Planctomycetota bacterium]
MIIVMKPGAAGRQVGAVLRHAESLGLRAHLSNGDRTSIIRIAGDDRRLDAAGFLALKGVERVIPIHHPFKLASREARGEDTVVRVDGLAIGGGTFTVIAGPCAVESLEQTLEAARRVKKAGAHILRGGAFKPRTSPYSFQGLGPKGLEILSRARAETGLAIVTEVMSAEDVSLVAEHADLLQVGARNMQNFNLLDAVGRQKRPVLLKRGMMSTVEELLLSAEHILSRGNRNVILCERGVRTFEKYTRNTLDISTVPVVKRLSHLPIIVDPSHAAGVREYVAALARASVAVGADGMMVEVHPQPEKALCDGPESLSPDEFDRLMKEVRLIAKAVGTKLAR